MKITAVIMAGGSGVRFWPKSRNNCPKQFLSLTKDGETMIQKTVRRIRRLVPDEDIFIVTNEAYMELASQQLSGIPAENFLAEPCSKNTAPCIAYAAEVIKKKYGDAVMIVLPSDHLVRFEELFISALKKAASVACEGEKLVTIGITPSYPETGYGYIRFGEEKNGAFEVHHFAEKPDRQTASKYIMSGKYLWNSGVFVWQTSSFLAQLEKYLPDVYRSACAIGEAIGDADSSTKIRDIYGDMMNISIDTGLMERSPDIYVIPGSFGWDDVGSWGAVARINDTDDDMNYSEGDVVSVGNKRTVICGGKRLVAAAGLDDIIIVDTDDVLLVCAKNSTSDIRKIVAQLSAQGREDLI